MVETFPIDTVIGQLQQINANTNPVSGVSLSSPFPLNGQSASVRGIYTQQTDVINLLSFSSLAGVILLLRINYIDNTGNPQILEFQQVTNSTRGVQKNTFSLPLGFMYAVSVLSLNPNSPFTTKRGQIYVSVAYGPGTMYQGSPASWYGLISCYLQDGPVWPTGKYTAFTEGPGYVYNVAPSNPVAGADIAITVPTGARWRVLGMSADLVTSVAVANRQVVFYYTPFTYVTPPLVIQTATSTVAYNWVPGYPAVADSAVDGFGDIRAFIPNPILPAGSLIQTTTQHIDAGDQWQSITLEVEEWLET